MENFDEQLSNLFENADFNSSLLNVIIDNNIQKLLFDYQVLHVQNLIDCLNNNNTVIDTSDTGCGKTYSALAMCKQLNLIPIIFCPKTIMSNWSKVAKIFKVKPLFICNYETIRNSKYYVNQKRKECPYIRYIKSRKCYIWKNITKDHIFIFDEVHFCRNKSTLNGKLLISVKKYKSLLLMIYQVFKYLPIW
jgi:Rad3-related DNA helicase